MKSSNETYCKICFPGDIIISLLCEIKQMNTSRSNSIVAQNVVKDLAILINREKFLSS